MKLRHENEAGLNYALSRRRLLHGMGGALVAAGSLGQMSSPAIAAREFEGKNITFASWGGAYQDAEKIAYCDPFTAKTGVTVTQDGPIDDAKLRAMVESGQMDWDVVDITHSTIYTEIKDSLLEKLDLSKIHSDRINKRFKNDYGVADSGWSYSIAYSTKAFKEGEHPKSWADVFDIKKFPGSRALYGEPDSLMEIALLADGVPPEDLYKLLATDDGVKMAFAKLDTIKNNIIFFDTNSRSQQLFIDGEVSCGLMLNNRIYDAVKKGGAVGIEWNQNIQSADYLAIPKGSKNVELAHMFIDEMTVAENQAKLANLMALSPMNQEALHLVDPAILPWLCTNPENEAKGFPMNAEFWRTNHEKLKLALEEWKLS
jgi:putative spermidine/putrescine transport system substrate-binding protein